MQKILIFLGLALSLLILNTKVVNATSVIDNTLLYEKTTTQTIKRGLSYDKIERLTQAGWMDIHVLKMEVNSGLIEHFTDTDVHALKLTDNTITLDMLNIELQAQALLEPQDRHYRKGLGLTEDGTVLIAIVIDKNNHSIGATTSELNQIFLEQKVMEHNDFDNLVFLSHAETEPARRLVIDEPYLKMFLNSTIEIAVKAVDKYNQPVTIENSEFAWSVSGISGSFNGNTFTATTAGKGKITVYHGSIYQSIDIEVVESLADLTVENPMLYLNLGETGSFSFTGIDLTGYSETLHPSLLTYSVSDATLGSFNQGMFVAADKKGITKVVARFGGRSISGYVVVGKESQILDAFRTNPILIEKYPIETVEASIGATTEVMKDQVESLRLSYSLDVSEVEQSVTLYLTEVLIDQPAEMLTLEMFGNRRGHQLSMDLRDSEGKVFNIVLSEQVDWLGWRRISANLPTQMVYPVNLVSLHITALQNQVPITTALFFDSLKVESYLSTSHIRHDVTTLINDPLMTGVTPSDAYKISAFGPSNDRYRLLDSMILNQAYKNMNNANLSVFAGDSNIDPKQIDNDQLVWRNTFDTKETRDIKLITLGTSSGGLRTTDASQFQKLQETLSTTSQNNIVIIANRSPNRLSDFNDDREAAVIHELLKVYRQKSGKNIFYVNGNRSKMNVTIKDHIRYIDLNGLDYTVDKSSKSSKSRLIDLNNSFYTLEFYVVNRQVSYRLNNLFPMVTY